MKDMQATSYDIQAIQRRLPHRFPFLMIDAVEESGPGYAVAIKNVSVNEPWCQGHFPGRPIMPGVLVTEACLQASAFMGPIDENREGPPDATNSRFFCVSFNMKFTGPVHPGDRLRVDVRLVKRMGQMIRVKARVANQVEIVAAGDLGLATQLKD